MSDFTLQQVIKIIEDHNHVHSYKEPHAIFITHALNLATSYLHKIDAGELVPVAYGYIVWKSRYTGGYKYIRCPKCGNGVEIEQPFLDKIPYCSECGSRLCSRILDRCPSCGAIMRKEKLHE